MRYVEIRFVTYLELTILFIESIAYFWAQRAIYIIRKQTNTMGLINCPYTEHTQSTVDKQ